MTQAAPVAGRVRAFAPLADRTFRSIWSASLLSNLGQLVFGVATAWEMTRLTSSPQTIAAVQTALSLPSMLIAVPAGALADMFDRRRIAMAGLALGAIAAAVLTAIASIGTLSPFLLLLFCFLIGSGAAIYSPSWQASIAEQVPPAHLPAAVALGSISYNIARSFGPALGGLIVLTFGVRVAFGATALLFLPLMAAFFLWRRKHTPPRLPPERLDRAIISGIRYALHAAPVRAAMARSFAWCLATGAVISLAPLIAKQQLGGDAATFGLLLGAYGVGAILGAMVISDVRERLRPDTALAMLSATMAVALLVVAISHSVIATCAALIVGGACNMLTVSLLNVGMQFAVPRWVAARALAWFQACLTGGIALGAILWGDIAGRFGLEAALAASAATVLATALLGWIMPSTANDGGLDLVPPSREPDVALDLSARSGPVVIEMDYRVDPAEARDFYDAMLKLRRARLRNGAFGWSLSRDIAAPALWTERFEFPTWQDYLRQRTRFTEADLELQLTAERFNHLSDQPRVRRRLERPFGSVRAHADTPVPAIDRIDLYAAP